MPHTDADSPLVVHMIDELPRDGAEMLLLDLMRHREPGFRYAVVCIIRGGPLEEEFARIGIPVIIFGRRGKLDVSLVLRLASWLRRNRAAIVHTHLFTADTYGRLAAKLAGVPVVFSTVHNIVNPWKGGFRKGIDRLFARLSTRVIGCSEEVTQALATRDGIPAERLMAIPNGIDLRKFAQVSGEGVRAEFGLPADRPLLGVVGRLHPQKGHEDLFRALATMPQARAGEVSCLVVGTGELQDALHAMVRQMGLEPCVVFTGMRTDVPRLVAALDVFVMPSRWEGLPIALLEAMASAKPVICTRVGGIPDVVRDGDNGLLIDASDPAQLQQRIAQLLDSPDERTRLGLRARDTVIERFDVTRTAAAYNNLHRQALGLAPAA
ncbi:glycosyltransferase [Thiomonas sp.]|uniref:glycosyltransferase n=1 Tax=Thiomonas sp. TaxID=2047785 RepID=UPI002588F026|nr:glycosyltransferase [Thiomonas sp.]